MDELFVDLSDSEATSIVGGALPVDPSTLTGGLPVPKLDSLSLPKLPVIGGLTGSLPTLPQV